MTIKEILINIRSVTDQHVCVTCDISISNHKSDMKTEWTLYIAGITSKEFTSLAGLEKYTQLLCGYLKTATLKGIGDAVAQAEAQLNASL